jgi:N-acetylglucosamine-6-phosphate deacetylase
MYIKNAQIVTSDGIIEGSVEIKNGKILSILKDKFPDGDGIDAGGNFLAPGFIDMHIHGISGFDAMDKNYNSINSMSKSLLKHGVTSFVPTTMTVDIESIKNSVENISKAMIKGVEGANIAGIHIEGPFISPEMVGAQDPKYVRKPSKKDFEYIVGPYSNNIKTVTIAPEVDGAVEFIKYIASLGINASCGHTNGKYDDLVCGIKAGISHATHLYNAMRGFHHREPGIVGGIFDTGITTEIIADGIHSHFAAVRCAYRLKGPDKLALITDAMMACDMKDGNYTLGGQKVYVKDGAARIAGGQLAGSTLTLDKAVKNVINNCAVNITDAVKMASSTPARILKIDNEKGYIKVGYDADIVIFDDNINIIKTFVSGIEKYNIKK